MGVGSSRNESDYSRERYPHQFPAPRGRSCKLFGRAHFFPDASHKKKLHQTQHSLLFNRHFSDETIDQCASPEMLQTTTLERRKSGLGTSPRLVGLIPRRDDAKYSLPGQKPIPKQIKRYCQPQNIYRKKWLTIMLYSSAGGFPKNKGTFRILCTYMRYKCLNLVQNTHRHLESSHLGYIVEFEADV